MHHGKKEPRADELQVVQVKSFDKMNRKIFVLMVIACAQVLCIGAQAQNARDLIRLGNVAYRSKQYDKAETQYLKSIAKSPSFEAYYNLGNVYVMQQKDSTAFDCYLKADSVGTDDAKRRAMNFHNMGNIWYAQGLEAMKRGQNANEPFKKSIELYKRSLRCNPDDNETRYNLAMAQHMLKNNPDNGGGGQDNKDKNEDKKDQQQQQQQQQNQQDNQDKKEQQKQEQPKDEMSDQVAEQLLNSAQQDEKNVQRKVNQQQNGKRKTLEKDW